MKKEDFKLLIRMSCKEELLVKETIGHITLSTSTFIRVTELITKDTSPTFYHPEENVLFYRERVINKNQITTFLTVDKKEKQL